MPRGARVHSNALSRQAETVGVGKARQIFAGTCGVSSKLGVPTTMNSLG